MPIDANVITAVASALGLIAVDWALGVVSALRAGTFSWSRLPAQLESTVLPLGGGLSIIAAVQSASSAVQGGGTKELFALVVASAGTVAVKAGADIKTKLAALVG